MDQALNQKIDAFIAANKEQILQDIADLVAINSVEGTPEEGAPYGKGPKAALEKTLEMAAAMGLKTRNCEDHIGYAELEGAEPEKYLATICHVDVVPEGNGWTADPFTMQIRDGYMIGRGVADDKGPMVATLYALKFLKEEGVSLRYPIRALVGDNEETHMHDVDYYLEHYQAPVFCFTPDAEFPVCNGEKGHFDGKLVSPVCNGEIKDFVGGVATNAVPDRASALVETDITQLRNAPTSRWSRKAAVSASAAGARAAMLPCRRAPSTPSVWWRTICWRMTCATRQSAPTCRPSRNCTVPPPARVWASSAPTAPSAR